VSRFTCHPTHPALISSKELSQRSRVSRAGLTPGSCRLMPGVRRRVSSDLVHPRLFDHYACCKLGIWFDLLTCEAFLLQKVKGGQWWKTGVR
jgi:hypothetical protein